jgi:hypothetical protein
MAAKQAGDMRVHGMLINFSVRQNEANIVILPFQFQTCTKTLPSPKLPLSVRLSKK